MTNSPGDPVMLRNCGFFMGDGWCTPHALVQETPDLVVLFRPEGVQTQIWQMERQEFVEMPVTRMDMLRLMFPGRMYAIELFFDAGKGTPPYSIFEGEGRFRGWKVNMEAAFRRTPIGFDTTDHFVDIVVKPDLTWYWKDEEDMRQWRKKGAYQPGEIESFLAAGREAEEMIKRRLAPFDEVWSNWQDESLAGRPLPKVPEGWEQMPGVNITMSLNRPWDFWKGAAV